MDVLNKILEHKLIAIIRGADPADVLKIAGALYQGGIRILEITMNSIEPLQVIKEITTKLGDNMLIGAGTVLDEKMARDAISAGAKFILSPIVDVDVIKVAKSLGAVSIPGAYTATEIYRAHKLGADIVKVFPASSPAYIKDLRGPLNNIHLLPTGGVTLENVKEFKSAGASGFGIGSSLVDTKQLVTDEYLEALTEKARRFVEATA